MISTDVVLSLQTALQRDMEVVSNNMANVTTAGFRSNLMLLSESVSRPSPSQIYSFVSDLATIRDTRGGAFKKTGDPFHAYLNGKGYFAVQTPNGVRYTRSGMFTMDGSRQVVTAQGYPVLDINNGTITVPENVKNLVLSKDGTFSEGSLVIGQLGRFSFADDQALKDEQDSLFSTTQAPIADEDTQTIQYGYEASNVSSVQEMTKLMSIYRSYQQAQSYLEKHSKMLSDSVQQLIKLAPAA